MTFSALSRQRQTMPASNYEVALAAERKRVVRCFHHYDVDQVALLASRVGPSRKCLDRGEFFYVHPAVPGIAFSTRGGAAEAALTVAP